MKFSESTQRCCISTMLHLAKYWLFDSQKEPALCMVTLNLSTEPSAAITLMFSVLGDPQNQSMAVYEEETHLSSQNAHMVEISRTLCSLYSSPPPAHFFLSCPCGLQHTDKTNQWLYICTEVAIHRADDKSAVARSLNKCGSSPDTMLFCAIDKVLPPLK